MDGDSLYKDLAFRLRDPNDEVLVFAIIRGGAAERPGPCRGYPRPSGHSLQNFSIVARCSAKPSGGRTSCAVRRLVASPAQQGGTWREVSGSTGLPDAERLTEQEHVGWPWPGEGTEGARGRTRVTWQRLDCLKSNLRSVNTRTRRNGVWNRCRVMRWHGM